MQAKVLFLVVLVGFVLLQFAAAATPAKEAPKDAPKSSVPEAAAKQSPPKPAASQHAAEIPKPAEVPKPAETPKAADVPKAHTETTKAAKPVETPKPAAEPPKPAAEPPKPAAESPKPASPPKPAAAETPKSKPVEAEKPQHKAEAKAETPSHAHVHAHPAEDSHAYGQYHGHHDHAHDHAHGHAHGHDHDHDHAHSHAHGGAKSETPKSAKAEEPKPSKTADKTEPKRAPAPSKEGFSFDPYIALAKEYAEHASVLAGKWWKIAREQFAELSTHGVARAGEFFVAAKEATTQLLELGSSYTLKEAERLVDKYLDPPNAKLVKKNFLNWYGVAGLVGTVVSIFIFVSHFRWVFSLTSLRAFLSATTLGVYTTLLLLSVGSGKNPLSTVSSKVFDFQQWSFGIAVITTVLSFLALVTQKGRVISLIVFTLSAGLFVDYFHVRPQLEAAVGPVPAFVLETVVFFLQTILIFDTTIQKKHSRIPIPSRSAVPAGSSKQDKGPSAGFIKDDKKASKGSPKGK